MIIARGRSLQMIICKRPDPLDDHLQTTTRTRTTTTPITATTTTTTTPITAATTTTTGVTEGHQGEG